MRTIDVVKSIDWKLLREQKKWLLNIEHEMTDGLLGLIDVLQDAAIDDELASEEIVFGEDYENI